VKRSLDLRDLVLVLAVVIVWGFNFVPIKWALEEIPPFALVSLRFLLATVPAIFFVQRPAVRWRVIIAYGFAIGVFQFGLLFLGIRLGMPAGLASLVVQLQVFFTIGLAVVFMDDRVHRWNIAGAAVALVGIVVLGAYKFASGLSGTLAGFFIIIAAAFAWAVGNVVAKRAHGVDTFALVVWSSLVPPLPLALLSYVFEGGTAPWHAIASASWKTWACVFFLAYAATLFGYAKWNDLLHRYPTALISPFALLIPVAGLASGAIFLAEYLAPVQFAGVALVFAGLVINVYGARGWRALAHLGRA
jgi:O-acetylserine/cysteine efflux transporter